jgi:hypothetical protein
MTGLMRGWGFLFHTKKTCHNFSHKSLTHDAAHIAERTPARGMGSSSGRGILRFAQDDNYRGIFGLPRMTMLVCGNSERKTRQGELFVVSRESLRHTNRR